MGIDRLVGLPICLRGHDLSGGLVPAVIRAVDPASSALLLQLIPSLRVGSTTCGWAVAGLRLADDSLESLEADRTLGCAVTCIPDERYDPARPFDLGWWRGGGAFIADVVLSTRS